jgi:hypothetical protein
MTAIAKVVSPPPALFGMVQWNRYIDRGKTISTMSMTDFWPEKNSNNFLSVKGSRHFPRGPFLSEQSYIYNSIVNKILYAIWYDMLNIANNGAAEYGNIHKSRTTVISSIVSLCVRNFYLSKSTTNQWGHQLW